jgi:hypothetical protein
VVQNIFENVLRGKYFAKRLRIVILNVWQMKDLAICEQIEERKTDERRTARRAPTERPWGSNFTGTRLGDDTSLALRL